MKIRTGMGVKILKGKYAGKIAYVVDSEPGNKSNPDGWSKVNLRWMKIPLLKLIHKWRFTRVEDEKRIRLKSYLPFRQWIRSLKHDPLIEFTGKALQIRCGAL